MNKIDENTVLKKHLLLPWWYTYCFLIAAHPPCCINQSTGKSWRDAETCRPLPELFWTTLTLRYSMNWNNSCKCLYYNVKYLSFLPLFRYSKANLSLQWEKVMYNILPTPNGRLRMWDAFTVFFCTKKSNSSFSICNKSVAICKKIDGYM